jgi:WD40 repeat protein
MAYTGNGDPTFFDLDAPFGQFPRPAEIPRLDPPAILYHAAVSLDGRWLVSGSQQTVDGPAGGVRIWDAHSGKLVKQLVSGEPAVAFFEPHGQLLTITPAHFQVWESGTWAEVKRIRRQSGDRMWTHAISPDGTTLALGDTKATSRAAIELIDIRTWKQVARLQGPDNATIRQVAFSPDGGTLICSNETRTIRLWDLRAIRQQLREIGLDWDLPPYPPAPPPADVNPVRRFEVDLTGPPMN